MIRPAVVRDIIELYTKHGWVLRRVLLSAGSRAAVGSEAASLFGDAAVIDSPFDAAWFSRPPADGPIAWEIRNLGDTPYALVEHLDESSPDFENSLAEVGERLVSAVSAKRSA
jgi:hypothetical protein